jgi:hypothetical protein
VFVDFLLVSLHFDNFLSFSWFLVHIPLWLGFAISILIPIISYIHQKKEGGYTLAPYRTITWWFIMQFPILLFFVLLSLQLDDIVHIQAIKIALPLIVQQVFIFFCKFLKDIFLIASECLFFMFVDTKSEEI